MIEVTAVVKSKWRWVSVFSFGWSGEFSNSVSAAFGLMGLAPFVRSIIQQTNTNSPLLRREILRNFTICSLCQTRNFLAQWKPEICQIFRGILNKARWVFCGYIWVYLFLVQTRDVVSWSDPMRHSHFTNHVAMAEGSWSHISPSSKHFWHRTTHPPPKQTSQKPGWAKEKKMKGVEEKFQDQSFWRKRQLQAKSLVSYLFFLSALTDRSSRNRLVLDQHTYTSPSKKNLILRTPPKKCQMQEKFQFFLRQIEIWFERIFLKFGGKFLFWR